MRSAAEVPPTLLDRANPVTRLAAAALLALPVLLTIDVVSAATSLGLTLVAAGVVGYRPAVVLRRTWPLLLAAPVAALSMALYGRPSGDTYVQWFLVHVTEGSLTLAVAVLVRVLALGVPAVLLFSGIDPTDLADGLAQVWRLPARFVLGTLAGFRLVGELLGDWRMLALARRARGLGDTGGLRRFATMAFSLLVLALRRGSALATAMEARGFGAPTPRTWARESRLGPPDQVMLAVALVMAATPVIVTTAVGTFRLAWT